MDIGVLGVLWGGCLNLAPTSERWEVWAAVVLAVALLGGLLFVLLRFLVWLLLFLMLELAVRHFPRALALFGDAGRRLHLYVLSCQAQNDGRPVEAVKIAKKLLDETSSLDWIFVNCAVNALINAGSYREALRVPTRWSKSERRRHRRRNPSGYLLVQINLAEALYNLGRLGCAANVLEEISEDCAKRGSALVRAGLSMQKGWLLMLRGQPELALQHLATLKARHLPRQFRAELAFAQAAALRDLGRLSEARAVAQRGLSLSRRESSKRNALFLLGSIAAREGQPERAVALLEQGAAHSYIGQGGDGLLLLAEQYGLLGRELDRDKAYQRSVERDPQSSAARIASRRLGGAILGGHT